MISSMKALFTQLFIYHDITDCEGFWNAARRQSAAATRSSAAVPWKECMLVFFSWL